MKEPDGSLPAIAVTGACGFVGANVVLHLAQRGHRVIACDRDPPPDPLRQTCSRYADKIHWLELDVTVADAWHALDGEAVEMLIHGAALTPGNPDPSPELTTRVNVLGTVSALEHARDRGYKRFVLISSSGVYGASQTPAPMPEIETPESQNSYAASKLAAEQYVSLYRRSFGLDACSVRLAGVYGPWERPTTARKRMSSIFTLATAAIGRRPVRVAGMSIGRDWIYAPDVAAGVAHLATQPTLSHDLFNLGSGTRTTLEQIVRILQKVVPGVAIETSPAEQADVAYEADDERSALDVTRIRAAGFEAATDAETGLRGYLEWLDGEGRFLLRA